MVMVGRTGKVSTFCTGKLLQFMMATQRERGGGGGRKVDWVSEKKEKVMRLRQQEQSGRKEEVADSLPLFRSLLLPPVPFRSVTD